MRKPQSASVPSVRYLHRERSVVPRPKQGECGLCPLPPCPVWRWPRPSLHVLFPLLISPQLHASGSHGSDCLPSCPPAHRQAPPPLAVTKTHTNTFVKTDQLGSTNNWSGFYPCVSLLENQGKKRGKSGPNSRRYSLHFSQTCSDPLFPTHSPSPAKTA